VLQGKLTRTIFNATRKRVLFRIGLGRPEAVGYPHLGAPVVVLAGRDPGYQEGHEFAALLVSLGAVSLDLFHARPEL
jgi:hypothetical protein